VCVREKKQRIKRQNLYERVAFGDYIRVYVAGYANMFSMRNRGEQVGSCLLMRVNTIDMQAG
jgi:hypothetical protein